MKRELLQKLCAWRAMGIRRKKVWANRHLFGGHASVLQHIQAFGQSCPCHSAAHKRAVRRFLAMQSRWGLHKLCPPLRGMVALELTDYQSGGFLEDVTLRTYNEHILRGTGVLQDTGREIVITDFELGNEYITLECTVHVSVFKVLPLQPASAGLASESRARRRRLECIAEYD